MDTARTAIQTTCGMMKCSSISRKFRSFADIIIYEDNHLLVVNKPNGIRAQSDNSGKIDILSLSKEYLKVKYLKKGDAYLGLVHRIDMPVSGVMMFCKTSKSSSRVCEYFRSRSVVKGYYCVVHGRISESQSCTHYFEKKFGNIVDIFDEKVSNVEGQQDRIAASLSFHVVQVLKHDMTLLKVFLETGRKHQIRAQLSYMGHPIVGDLKYGAPFKLNSQNIALHAYNLSLPHPINKNMMSFAAKLPVWWEKQFGVDAIEPIRSDKDYPLHS